MEYKLKDLSIPRDLFFFIFFVIFVGNNQNEEYLLARIFKNHYSYCYMQ